MRPSNFKDFYAFAFRYSLTGKFACFQMNNGIIKLLISCIYLVISCACFRRAAEDAGHWQHLSIDEDSSRFPVPPSGGFLHPVSTGMCVLFLSRLSWWNRYF